MQHCVLPLFVSYTIVNCIENIAYKVPWKWVAVWSSLSNDISGLIWSTTSISQLASTLPRTRTTEHFTGTVLLRLLLTVLFVIPVKYINNSYKNKSCASFSNVLWCFAFWYATTIVHSPVASTSHSKWSIILSRAAGFKWNLWSRSHP